MKLKELFYRTKEDIKELPHAIKEVFNLDRHPETYVMAAWIINTDGYAFTQNSIFAITIWPSMAAPPAICWAREYRNNKNKNLEEEK